MTRLLILLALIASPASAALVPSIYAREFCALRMSGASVEAARKAAFHAAWYEDPIEPRVLANGRMMHASTVRAVDEVAELCPGLLR